MNSAPRVLSNLSPAGMMITGGRPPAVTLPAVPVSAVIAVAAESGTCAAVNILDFRLCSRGAIASSAVLSLAAQALK